MASLRSVEVVVSYPADVQHHVDVARRIITNNNRYIEKSDGLTLRVSDFRDALALYNPAGAQAEIDDRVFNGIDVFIGFMHVRFGRPVAGSNSGVEHEYAQALSGYKRHKTPKYILFGFSDELIRPSKTDGVQMEAVKKFRESIGDKQLYFDWETPEEFEVTFRQQLNELILRYKNDLNNYVRGGLRYR